ncbi:hypothetical protein OROGR_018638 [Orobanche gracilis]
MRSGGWAVQQALTVEAADVVKQAVLLAKRRGHAQVTPLHVANAMLCASTGLLRAACLESHSHPLHCKALELCFNVALNRLPATSSNPMLNPHDRSRNNPSISHALVAAFKRAQAHQRRSSVDGQHQTTTPLSAKIELAQLIISILTDPSVSRVMREAGFSSTQVKSTVEKSVSSINTRSTSPNTSPTNKDGDGVGDDDAAGIIVENLLLRGEKKSLVLVGECVSSLESVIKALMEKVDRGEVPERLREIKFITIPPLYAFCNLGREEVVGKIEELTCLVKGFLGKGVVLYLGDFKWISDHYRVRSTSEEEKRGRKCHYSYDSVEHVIEEIGRLVRGIRDIEKFWLMGVANFQTYTNMRCRNVCSDYSWGNVWNMHPVTIPANSMRLISIVSESDEQIEARRRSSAENPRPELLLTSGVAKVSCYAHHSVKFEDGVRNSQKEPPTLSSLPAWLKDEKSRRLMNNQNQNSDAIMKKNENSRKVCSSNYSASSSNGVIMQMDYWQKFNEFNPENLNILCAALEKKVPCRKEIILEIAGTILQCRSGMLRRKDQTRGNSKTNDVIKQETWLFFLGPDDGAQAKEEISKELAKVIFGSYSNFLSIGLSSDFLSLLTPSDEYCRNKRGRGRDEDSCRISYIDRFYRAVSEDPHRVFLLEDLDRVDHSTRMGIKRAIETGTIRDEKCVEEIGLCDAIIVLSCESFRTRSTRGCSPMGKTGSWISGGAAGGEEDDISQCVSLDLNISIGGTNDGGEDRAGDDLGDLLEIVDRRVDFKTRDS